MVLSLGRFDFGNFAVIGLVCLDHLPAAAEPDKAALAHTFANAVRHKPSRAVGNAERAVQLMGTHALLASYNRWNASTHL